jgi:hypothetical protein
MDKRFGPTVLSTAHDWVSLLPADAGVRCVRCKLKAKVEDMSKVERCVPHREFAISGYRDESNG